MIHVVVMGPSNFSDTPEEKAKQKTFAPIRIFCIMNSSSSRPAIVTVKLIQIVIIPNLSLTSPPSCHGYALSILASEPPPVQWVVRRSHTATQFCHRRGTPCLTGGGLVLALSLAIFESLSCSSMLACRCKKLFSLTGLWLGPPGRCRPVPPVLMLIPLVAL